MIEPNELRIGNALFDRNNDIVIVESILDYGINYDPDIEACKYQFRDNELRPIPLTEERLLKCGFEQVDDMPYHPDMKTRSLYINTLILRKNTYSNLFEFHFQHKDPSMFENTEVKYLHQLQNLYFALDGKELEINNYAL